MSPAQRSPVFRRGTSAAPGRARCLSAGRGSNGLLRSFVASRAGVARMRSSWSETDVALALA